MSTPNHTTPPPEKFRDHFDAVITAVLAACDPRELTARALRAEPFSSAPVHVIAFGKASMSMTHGAGEVLGHRLRIGCALAPAGVSRPAGFPQTVAAYPVDHPLPTDRNVEAAQVVRYFSEDFGKLAAAGSDALLLVLISGGGSAQLTLPPDGLSLAEVRRATDFLLRAGADIHELNTVRKHIDQLKGGRLARMAAPGKVRVLALSDVVGDDLGTIASGPCHPDKTTFADAAAVVKKYQRGGGSGGGGELSEILNYLQTDGYGSTESPKPADPVFKNVRSTIIGSNHTALEAAQVALVAMGFEVAEMVNSVSGDAATVGIDLARRAKKLADSPGPRPAAIIMGGETTVRAVGNGVGGRNQELALAATIELDGRHDIALAAFATDGVDGPTDSAGAAVNGQLATIAAVARLAPAAFLAQNDSHTFFSRMDIDGHRTLIRTGPTGTNVGDLLVALVY